MIIDEVEVRKAISMLKPNGQLYEIRLVPLKESYKTPTYCGYFDNVDVLVDALEGINSEQYNVYFTLNEVDSACRSRQQYGRFMEKCKTTSDNDVVGYDYLMVDLDPIRIDGVSSSDEELQKAKEKANEIYVFMKNIGFYKPIIAYSGNGVHLLYKVNLSKTQERIDLMHKCLNVLSMYFSDEYIKVDTVNYNPSRICKLYGTVARKGANDTDNGRPHRLSRIIGDNDEPILTTDIGYIKKLADMDLKKDEPMRYNNYSPSSFDLDEWLDKYGVGYRKASYHDGDKYILTNGCPFNSDHKGKDACIFHSRGGALGFHCFHNSCADKTWKDVRLLFEPDAYEKKKMQYSNNYYSKPNAERKKTPEIIPEEGKAVFLTAEQIRECNEPDPEFIPTGIMGFDKLERGLARGDVSVWTGNSGGGKSSIIAEIILNMADKGYSVASYSGEMTKKKTLNWIHLMAAGKNNIVQTNYEGYYAVPIETQIRIDKWLGDKFLLYDNKYGHNFVAIYDQLEKLLSSNPKDVVILDNLMILDITDLSREELEAQKLFLLKLKELAPKYNCHVMCVCHPKKNYGLIRVADIKGSTDVRALADEIILMHRVNDDFKKGAKEYFDWKDSNPYFEADNLIEIGKSRDGANADKFVDLYFERETKRLKNYKSENKIYGWDKSQATDIQYGFEAIGIEDMPFGE